MDKKDKNRKSRSARSPKGEFDQKLLDLRRVTRVVAGGKRMRFRAVMAIGDRKGRVGVGFEKGADVSIAVEKAVNAAKKNLITVPLDKNRTIPHEIKVKYGSAEIILRPAPVGRGIMAGSAVRVICDLAGIADISAKVLSVSSNKLNISRATIEALKRLRSESVRKLNRPNSRS